MKKNITRREMNKMIYEKILSFNGAAQILKNLTNYNIDTDSFIWNGLSLDYVSSDVVLVSALET
jgi:hypothetical protein